MTQATTNHPRGGWQKDEIDLLFSAVKEAAQGGKPLRDVFADVGDQLSRKSTASVISTMRAFARRRSWRPDKRLSAPLRRRSFMSFCGMYWSGAAKVKACEHA